MAYNINTFLKPLSQSDRLIQIIDSNGVVKYSINPFTVKNTFVRGNVIYISLNSDREILIDFRNQTESRQAIVLLESQLETLRNKTPNYIDRIIEEYIHGIGPTGPQGETGPQGPTGPSNGGARFINTLLPNSPGSLGPVNFQLSMPWPYDSQRGISFQNEYIYINSSDIVRWYNVQLSFHIYNAANETYGYSLKYNTGSGTYSLMDTNINGASDSNKRQTTCEIIRVPAGVTASLYFTRYTTVTDEEAVIGSLNIIEII